MNLKILKQNLIDKRKCLDFMMASVIFIVAIIEFISWRLSFGKSAIVIDTGNNYLIYYYPLMTTLTIWVFSLFLFLKVLRYKSCIYSLIISSIYFSIQTFNVSAYLLKFGSIFYNEYIYPVFLCTIMSLTFIKILRWFFQNRF